LSRYISYSVADWRINLNQMVSMLSYSQLPIDCIQADVDDDTFDQLITICINNNIDYDIFVHIVNAICSTVDPTAECDRIIAISPENDIVIKFLCDTRSNKLLNKVKRFNKLIGKHGKNSPRLRLIVQNKNDI